MWPVLKLSIDRCCGAHLHLFRYQKTKAILSEGGKAMSSSGTKIKSVYVHMLKASAFDELLFYLCLVGNLRENETAKSLGETTTAAFKHTGT